MFSHHCGKHFYFFIALSLLVLSKDVIIANNMDLDELLQFANGLGRAYDVEAVIAKAHELYLKFAQSLSASEISRPHLAQLI